MSSFIVADFLFMLDACSVCENGGGGSSNICVDDHIKRNVYADWCCNAYAAKWRRNNTMPYVLRMKY